MNFNLKNKVILVSGSSRGIGLGIAKAFLEHGSKVIITGRHENSLDKAFQELSSISKEVYPQISDTTDAVKIKNLVTKTVETHGQLDAVICNVGMWKGPQNLQRDEEMLNYLSVNLIGNCLLFEEAVPYLAKSELKAALFTSSIVAYRPLGGDPLQAAAKSGIISAMQNYAKRHASKNIRVNAIAPGNIHHKTGSWEEKIQKNREDVDKFVNTHIPLKRLGTPSDIANAALFLCSPLASFITGITLTVDGGQSL